MEFICHASQILEHNEIWPCLSSSFSFDLSATRMTLNISSIFCCFFSELKVSGANEFTLVHQKYTYLHIARNSSIFSLRKRFSALSPFFNDAALTSHCQMFSLHNTRYCLGNIVIGNASF